jgi:hypothetical protein
MDKEQKRAYNKAYRLANLEKLRAKRKQWYWQNAERERARAREYQSTKYSKEQKAESRRRYRENHRDKLRKYMRERYAKKRDEILAYNRERRTHRPEVERDWYLRTEYGITLAQYNAMLAAQNGGCAICAGVDTKRRLAVDHDHATGVVRGILCENCNRGIGLFKDNPERLRRAVDYLVQSQRRS